MMIRIAEILHLVLPTLIVVGAILLFIPRLRSSSSCRRAILGSLVLFCALWVGCLQLLAHQFSKYSSFDYEVATSKSEILDWMGFQPTLLFDPGYGLGGKPAPGTAVWRYRLYVPPFKIDLGLEFDGDRLVGISHIL